MSARQARALGPRFTKAQANPPPTLGHVGSERALANAHEVDIDQLSPDPDQPRRHMDPGRLLELAQSIAAHGILQPLLVRVGNLSEHGDANYTIIAGGRRYAAVKLAIEAAASDPHAARLRRVPVLISGSEVTATRVLQLIENLQREDLPAVEEARALLELKDLEGLTLRGLAARVNRSLGYVEERLRLLRHPDVTDAVAEGVLTKSAGAAVASLKEADQRRAWLDRARAGELVDPEAVYASKPPRKRKRLLIAHDNAVKPPASSTAQAEQTTLVPGESHNVQSLDIASARSSTVASNAIRDRDEALRQAIEALLRRRKQTEEGLLRTVVRQILELGAEQERTCAALLAILETVQS